ncbi:MAG: PDZ domain-containing protein [Candidatus Hydrogenedentes bacterium]|nr:PDZ domain-containing protein [Candidatus Hydrogenedentota bacterium]
MNRKHLLIVIIIFLSLVNFTFSYIFAEKEEISSSCFSSELPSSLQSKILDVVEKSKPALVKIHVVEKYYSEGKELKQEKFGSGVVISPDGYIITNHHVAGKMFYGDCSFASLEKFPLELVGTDALTDVAVLRVVGDSKREFPYLRFGNSDEVKVGDYVLAMGSPMALSPSVTLGIVSNTQMTLPYRLNSYDMFSDDTENVGSLVIWIGHSAEITSGSSGGPLVNLNGEIIGINEIKYGLGGAIPSNTAKRVSEQIINYGKVKRSWVGVEVQPPIKNSVSGALIRHVYPNSPAEKSGLLPGDVILKINESPLEIKYVEQIPMVNYLLTSLPIQMPISLKYLRGSTECEVSLIPDEYNLSAPLEKELSEWGCTVKDINWLSASVLGRRDTKGVIITSIKMGGPTSQAKPPLQQNDIILSVEGKEVTDLSSVETITGELMANNNEYGTLVLIERKGKKIYSFVKLSKSKVQEKIRGASKSWIPVEVQVLTREIAEKLRIPEGGFLVTRVYDTTTQISRFLRTGDVIKELNGEKFFASKIEDYDEWKERIRNLPIGDTVRLKVLRGTEELDVLVSLEKEPSTPNLMDKFQDDWLGLTVRDLCFSDYVELNLSPDTKGVYIEQVVSGSWSALSRIEQGDILVSINDKTIDSVLKFEEVLKELRDENVNIFHIKIVRKNQIYFVEVQIK